MKALSIKEKIIIFLTAPVFIIHIYWAAKNFEKGGKVLRDEHYRWVQYGVLSYLLLLFVCIFLMNRLNYMPWQNQ